MGTPAVVALVLAHLESAATSCWSACADAQVNAPALQRARRLADNDIEGVVDPRQAAVLRLRAGDDEDV
jgi:hypothetical protein